MDDWNPIEEHHKNSRHYPMQSRVIGKRELDSLSSEEDEMLKHLFIAGIPGGITRAGLMGILSGAVAEGEITQLRMLNDKKNLNSQIAFLKTKSRASAIKIIEKCNGFHIGPKSLRIQYQKSKYVRLSDPSSPQALAPQSPSQAPVPQSPSLSSTSPDSFVIDKRNIEGSIDLRSEEIFRKKELTLDNVRSPGDDNFTAKPLGRSKLLLEVALGQRPTVGLSSHKKTTSSASAEKRPCTKCQKLGSRNCSRCKATYCSTECQEHDWTTHKKICKKPGQQEKKATKSVAERFEEDFESRFEFSFSDDFTQKLAEDVQELNEFERTILPLGYPTEVVLDAPSVSPFEIYFLPKRNVNKLNDLQDSLNSEDRTGKIEKLLECPSIGDFCICSFSVDKKYYRAVVERIVDKNVVQVKYIDYGNKEIVDLSRLNKLSKEFTKVPCLTVSCCLANVVSSGGNEKWSTSEVEFFRMMLKTNEEYIIIPVEILENNFYSVDIKNKDGADVADMLVKKGFAKYKKPPSLHNSPIEMLTSSVKDPSMIQTIPAKEPSSKDVTKMTMIQTVPAKEPCEYVVLTQPSVDQPSIVVLTQEAKEPSIPAEDSSVVVAETSNGQPNLTSFGWPADLRHMIGQKLSVTVVEYSEPGDLWVQIDRLSGREAMPLPLLRLPLSDHLKLISSEILLDSSDLNLFQNEKKEEENVIKTRRYYLIDLPTLLLKKELILEVTSINNPGNFFCHEIDQMAAINKVLPSNELYLSQSPIYDPEKDEICLAFLEKYDAFCRVMVVNREKSILIKVVAIDFGDENEISFNLIRRLPAELLKFPPLAFQCSLFVWNSIGNGIDSAKATNVFKSLVLNKKLKCSIIKKHQIYFVKKVSDATNGESITDAFIDSFEF